MNQKKFQKLGKRLKLEIATLFFTPFAALLFIITCIETIPWFLYRGFVTLIAKCFRPDLTHIMHSTSSWTGLENLSENPKSNIVVCNVFKGDISKQLEAFRSVMTSRVLEKKRENIENRNRNQNASKTSDTKLMFPELKQIWTSFMGYNFWKNEANFSVNDHVRICDFVGSDGFKLTEVVEEKDLQELVTRLVSAPWKLDFSPWEVLLVPNYKYQNGNPNPNPNDESSEEYSATIYRWHHAIGDGKSWVTLLVKDLMQYQDPIIPKAKVSKSYRKTNLTRLFLSPLKLPYDTAKNIVESFDSSDPSINPWHKPGKRSKEYYSSISPSIPVQVVKDLKNKFGVSYATVLISVISGGIGRVMKEAGQPVPKKMMGAIILPMPRHPGCLITHASMITLTWPVGTVDPRIRLKQVHDDINSKKSSLFPVAGFYGLKFGGLLPNFMRRYFYNKSPCTLGATLFPGPLTSPEFLGCFGMEGFFMAGIPPGQTGACVTSFVINGQKRIAVIIDKTLFPSQPMFQKLGGFITDEIQSLIKLQGEIGYLKPEGGEIV